MKLTIFAKTKKTSEGRSFRVYLTRMTRKSSGEEIPVRVNFREGLQLPTLFPVIIEVEKKDANLTDKAWTDDKGVQHISHNLWINAYTPSQEEYIDHSLDDFE